MGLANTEAPIITHKSPPFTEPHIHYSLKMHGDYFEFSQNKDDSSRRPL
jgi:hypothetical protein